MKLFETYNSNAFCLQIIRINEAVKLILDSDDTNNTVYMLATAISDAIGELEKSNDIYMKLSHDIETANEIIQDYNKHKEVLACWKAEQALDALNNGIAKKIDELDQLTKDIKDKHAIYSAIETLQALAQ